MEQWKDIAGYEGRYQISSWGRVRSGLRIRNPQPSGNGYLKIWLFNGNGNRGKRQFHVHRLVAEAFIGPCPDGQQVNHKDGDGRNNTLSNLEYVTRRGNQIHAIASGLKRTKLDEYAVRAIRDLAQCGVQRKELAATFSITRTMVGYIVNRQHWKHVA